MLPLFSDYESLEAVAAACKDCLACGLAASRNRVVFGAGNLRAGVMLVGQGPSLTDDRTGLPYSGPAGGFLDTALAQAGLTRDAVWITNLHKCVATKQEGDTGQVVQRPPKVEEVNACRRWLDEEIFWVKPVVLVAIGGPAAQVLLGRDFRLSEQRGEWHTLPSGLAVVATFQPTYLKRLSEWDRPAAVQGWRDMVADLRAAKAYAEKNPA